MISRERVSEELFFNPLRSRFLWTFVFAHAVVAIFLGRIYAFAPDEGGYLETYKHAYDQGFSTASILGWSNSQTFVLRFFYLPAKGLELIGMPDYLAIRFLAIGTSAIAVYLLLCIYYSSNFKNFPKTLAIILITPSLFLWMTLGLRESFIYLSLSLICIGFYLFTQHRERTAFPFLLGGNLVLFETKSYLFLLVLLSSLASIVFLLIRRNKGISRYGFVVIALILPLMINPQGVKYLSDSITGQLTSISTTGSASIAPVAISNTTVASENVATTAAGLKSVLTSHPRSLLARALSMFGMKSEPTPSTGTSTTPVAKPTPSTGTSTTPVAKPTPSTGTSTIAKPAGTYNTSRLNVAPAKVSKPVSIVARTAGFLLTPFPFIDNGSLFLNIAALESPFWWFLYIGFGVALWRRFIRKKFDELAIFVLSFSTLFILFSALTEINVGTMTRHRSVLVVPMLFLVLATSKNRSII